MWKQSGSNPGGAPASGREGNPPGSRGTIGKWRKSITRRLSLPSRRSSNSSAETPRRLPDAFPSLSGSDDQRRQTDDGSRGVSTVVFPIPPPPAPRGAPHGEPLSPESQRGSGAVHPAPALSLSSTSLPPPTVATTPVTVPAPPHPPESVPGPHWAPAPVPAAAHTQPVTSMSISPSATASRAAPATFAASTSGITPGSGSSAMMPMSAPGTTTATFRSGGGAHPGISPSSVSGGGGIAATPSSGAAGAGGDGIASSTAAGNAGNENADSVPTVAQGRSVISTVGALRAERQAAEEAAAAAHLEAMERAKSAAIAAKEAAESATRAAAAASAASAASAAVASQSRDSDAESAFGSTIGGVAGGGVGEEDDSGFGPLPDLDFADRVWRARPAGETRILSHIEMAAMSSASSQSHSHGRDWASDMSRSSGAPSRVARDYGAGGHGTASEEGDGVSRDASSGAVGVVLGAGEVEDRRSRFQVGGGMSGRRGGTGSASSGSTASKQRRKAKKYSRRHSAGDEKSGEAGERGTTASAESHSVFVSQSSILGTPTRAKSGRHLMTAPRSAGRKANQRPRVKKPRDSVGLNPYSSRPSEEGHEIQVDPPGPPRRRWQRWKGNNKFFLNGRIMLGVHYQQLVTSTTLLLSTWLVFFVFILPEYGDWYYCLAAVCLCIGSFVSLVYSSVLDPGIIPRRFPDTVPADVRDQLSYCITCHIVRPPRTKHCKHCNNCVLAFDHHCPWTGNCVGARNYRAFMAFIIFVTLSSGFVCTLSIMHTLTRTAHVGPESLTDAFHVPGSQFVSPPLGLWTAMITALVGALLAFHAYLLGKGQTTNEYLRGEKRRGGIPHGSFFPNCGQLWCGKQPPSLLPDMSDFPEPGDEPRDVNYAVNVYMEVYDMIHPSGDLV